MLMQCAALAGLARATISAGEPRTCAIFCDRVIETRKRRAKCRRAVTIPEARLINAALPRKSREKRNVVKSAEAHGAETSRLRPPRRRPHGLIRHHRLYTIAAPTL